MKGRILKIKTGYNPNSSSIGIDLIAFYTGAAALTLVFNTVVAILASGEPKKLAGSSQHKVVSEAGEAATRV